MTTVRQIGGLLSDGKNHRLFTELCQYRADVPAAVVTELSASPTATAALAAIRLQELSQTQTPVYRTLIARLAESQEGNGGWGSTLVTILATRALLNDPAGRDAGRRGIVLLAQVQKDDGSLPCETVRRLPGDAVATAFALVHLTRAGDFAHHFRIEAALRVLTSARGTMSPELLPFVKLAITRAGSSVGGQAQGLVKLAMAS